MEQDELKAALLSYGQLAMQYARTKDPALNAQLEEIEAELGLTRAEAVQNLKDILKS